MKGFKNSKVYVYKKGIIKTDVAVACGIIENIGNGCVSEGITLPEGAVLVPAFIDEHIHGAMGADTMDGSVEALRVMADALVKEGTATFLATTMTQSKENITRALKSVKEYKALEREEGAYLLGVHLEGPYISSGFAGAQPLEYVVAPDIKEFDEYNEASGNSIKIVTVAPETHGAVAFIKHLKSKGVIASIGHTSAKHEDIKKAVESGASNVTHTYNAQSPLHHRDIGTVGSALYYDGLNCEIICDTVHVSVPAIKLLIKNKPHDKVTLITDAMRAKQMPDGVSELGGQTVIVKNGEARLENGTLAGSVLKMNVAIKNLVDNGIDFCDAIDFATVNPAENLGIFDEYGSISVGKRADFTVLNENFEVLMTVRGGKIVYDNLKNAD